MVLGESYLKGILRPPLADPRALPPNPPHPFQTDLGFYLRQRFLKHHFPLVVGFAVAIYAFTGVDAAMRGAKKRAYDEAVAEGRSPCECARPWRGGGAASCALAGCGAPGRAAVPARGSRSTELCSGCSGAARMRARAADAAAAPHNPRAALQAPSLPLAWGPISRRLRAAVRAPSLSALALTILKPPPLRSWPPLSTLAGARAAPADSRRASPADGGASSPVHSASPGMCVRTHPWGRRRRPQQRQRQRRAARGALARSPTAQLPARLQTSGMPAHPRHRRLPPPGKLIPRTAAPVAASRLVAGPSVTHSDRCAAAQSNSPHAV